MRDYEASCFNNVYTPFVEKMNIFYDLKVKFNYTGQIIGKLGVS